MVVSLLLLALPCPAGEEGVLADRWYAWHLEGQPSGYLHITMKRTQEKEVPITFLHEIVAYYRGQLVSHKTQAVCKDNEWFTPVRLSATGQGRDMNSYEGAIDWGAEGGTLRAKVGSRREQQEQLPEQLVLHFNLFEIVRRLPFKKDAPFAFHLLKQHQLTLDKDHKLAYAGEELVTVEGQTKRLHRFDHTAKSITPAQYWVDERHELVRALWDERKEFILTTQEKALNALREGEKNSAKEER
jgi:hypothetical protein